MPLYEHEKSWGGGRLNLIAVPSEVVTTYFPFSASVIVMSKSDVQFDPSAVGTAKLW